MAGATQGDLHQSFGGVQNVLYPARGGSGHEFSEGPIHSHFCEVGRTLHMPAYISRSLAQLRNEHRDRGKGHRLLPCMMVRHDATGPLIPGMKRQ